MFLSAVPLKTSFLSMRALESTSVNGIFSFHFPSAPVIRSRLKMNLKTIISRVFDVSPLLFSSEDSSPICSRRRLTCQEEVTAAQTHTASLPVNNIRAQCAVTAGNKTAGSLPAETINQSEKGRRTKIKTSFRV